MGERLQRIAVAGLGVFVVAVLALGYLVKGPPAPPPAKAKAPASLRTAIKHRLCPPRRERAAVARGPHPPVVMLVFDEFSLETLLDDRMRIDPAMYPNFAALARQATVYRGFTAIGDDTASVTPALLTGDLWKWGRGPIYRLYPRNLFTLFAPFYDVHAWEEASRLCPHRICPNQPVHPIEHDPHWVLGELGSGRVQRFEAFLRRIHPEARPALWFKHVLLPHVPWTYLPDGQSYEAGLSPSQTLDDPATSADDPWLVLQKYQRHLLQAEFVDRLVGQLVARLRATGLYDRAMIVITADNGESLLREGHNSHEADTATAVDIASTPLIIKMPGQRAGGYSDRHVRTFDVLPTMAQAAGVPLCWPIAGQSALDPKSAIPSKVVVWQRTQQPLTLAFADYMRRMRAAVEWKVSRFGQDGGGPGLWKVGPDTQLVGRPRPPKQAATLRRLRAHLFEPRAFAHVDPTGPNVPSFVVGTVSGPGARPDMPIAIAVNGVIAATGRTSRLAGDPRTYFSAMVPPDRFRPGRNVITVYAVAGSGPNARLMRIAGTPAT